MQVRFLNLGDSALTLEFGDIIDLDLASRVTAFDNRLNEEQLAGHLNGLIETVPTYRSLTVIFDPIILPRESLRARLVTLLDESIHTGNRAIRNWRLPVCYHDTFGLDLASVAFAKGLTPAEVITTHAAQSYTVYMIGFLPGFPYMGDLNPSIHMPRHSTPRIRVPIGSVAITGKQTAIYPWESPGGWQILGRCPIPLFDAMSTEPALLTQGDRVEFEPVSIEQFHPLEQAAQKGSLDFSQFLVRAAK